MLVLVLCVGLANLPSTTQAATTITVTGRTDELDANGVCSLREAIQAANTDAAVDACPAGSGADTIVLDRGSYVLFGTDPRTQQQLTIDSDLTLTGAGCRATALLTSGPLRTIEIQRGSVPSPTLGIVGGPRIRGRCRTQRRHAHGALQLPERRGCASAAPCITIRAAA